VKADALLPVYMEIIPYKYNINAPKNQIKTGRLRIRPVLTDNMIIYDIPAK
jgi:hypothetical protein